MLGSAGIRVQCLGPRGESRAGGLPTRLDGSRRNSTQVSQCTDGPRPLGAARAQGKSFDAWADTSFTPHVPRPRVLWDVANRCDVSSHTFHSRFSTRPHMFRIILRDLRNSLRNIVEGWFILQIVRPRERRPSIPTLLYPAPRTRYSPIRVRESCVKIFSCISQCHRCCLRYLDMGTHDSVTRNHLGFLVGMSEFSISGAPRFSEDDHHVQFPVRQLRDCTSTVLASAT